jgi:hypothetical protein
MGTKLLLIFRGSNLLSLSFIFSFMVVTQLAAEDGIRWMNRWDASCYTDAYDGNRCRQDWYKTPQGSHLILWEVFKTIEAADSEDLFSERPSLSRYGFLYPEAAAYASTPGDYDGFYGERVERDLSVDGLPLGFLKDKSRLDNRNYVGLSCAACHTGQVTHGDDQYYVEGGQANADVADFLLKLGDALEANKVDRRKRDRFKSRFRSYAWDNKDWGAAPINVFAGERYLDEAIAYVRGFTNRNTYGVESGPTRLDAVGSILNQLHVSYANRDESAAVPLTAPVSYPYIWGVSKLECVQTNCISNEPLARNIGEVLGVFGYVNIDEDENVDNFVELVFKWLTPLFDFTPKVDNMFTLESSLTKVSPPKWPDSFPALDPQKLARGRDVYAANCSSCHVDTTDGVDDSELTPPNSIGRRYTKITRMPYADIGTDPAFAEDYGRLKAPTRILGTVLSIAAPDRVDPETGIPFGEQVPQEFNALILLGIAANVIKQDHFESLGFRLRAERAYPELSGDDAVEALRVDYLGGQVDRNTLTPTAYRAKPLDGIAFTGPYLHNGSVRTLSDLLKRPADRPTSFRTGTTEYDVANAGYMDAGDFVLDTTIRGNRKDGHDYGTSLTSEDKAALLEFLKSL